MGPEEIRQLIAVLSRMAPQQTSGLPGTGQNPNMMASYLSSLVGLSPNTISSSFNPEILLASGMFDPAQVQSAVQNIYRGQLGGFQQELAPYLAGTTPPPEATESFFSYTRDALLNNTPAAKTILMDPDQGLFRQIREGLISPQDAKNRVLGQDALSPSEKQIINDGIDTFSKELPQFLRNVSEYQATSGQKQMRDQAIVDALMMNAPTERGAYAEFVKSLGVPQLALLPAPYEQYQFQPESFVRPEIYSLAGRVKGSAERKISELAPAAEKRAGYISGVQQAGVARAKGAVEAGAASKATQAKRDFIEGAQKKADYFRTDAGKKEFARVTGLRVSPGENITPRINSWLRDQKKQADNVYSNVFAREVAAKGTISAPAVTAESLSPGLRSARRAQSTALKLAEQEYGRGVAGAQQLTRALTAAGITPFQQAMLNFPIIPAATRKRN